MFYFIIDGILFLSLLCPSNDEEEEIENAENVNTSSDAIWNNKGLSQYKKRINYTLKLIQRKTLLIE